MPWLIWLIDDGLSERMERTYVSRIYDRLDNSSLALVAYIGDEYGGFKAFKTLISLHGYETAGIVVTKITSMCTYMKLFLNYNEG